MVAIGLGLVWAGYAVTLWGYCLVRGYDVPFRDLFHASWPGGGTKSTPPPASQPAGGGGGKVLPQLWARSCWPG